MKKILLCLALVASSLFSNSLSEIKNSGVIRVGVFTDQPPFGSYKDGQFEGFEVDFANRIARDIFGQNGGKVEFVPTKAAERIDFLQNNKVDIILATLTITDERSRMVDFSMPYFAVNIGVLTRKDDNIKSVSDLRGRPVLVESGTTGELFFKKEGYTVVECPNSNECYRMLKDNKADAYANDNLIVLAYPVIDRSVSVDIKNLGASDFLGIAVQKGNKELLDVINKELINLSKEGFFRKSFKDTIDPFYKGTAEEKYFLLDDIYSIFG
ncbi:transporter substrate-binding domain-containing protein [Campylobacter corcagiensis]|uniref:Transporter substrate-binding domain-containing protein n=1 Tax=Campylobacter corcagiensis TaxID=1448857 RepID=A0A7M1LHQ6_9BACT|nr:transporter substrate-binding domain-containing protein [Campylobacter corcagiensis]QKF64418.1 amino acid ABC transporter, periplasmic cysteine-binding protein [Campylobacter corcagiensis]QOQ87396.1 transporter substrate-binding domain-containing protein [Campylobacter corcagiensis]